MFVSPAEVNVDRFMPSGGLWAVPNMQRPRPPTPGGMPVVKPHGLSGLQFRLVPRSVRTTPMGRTLENKQQIVDELKGLLGEADMALVLLFRSRGSVD